MGWPWTRKNKQITTNVEDEENTPVLQTNAQKVLLQKLGKTFKDLLMERNTRRVNWIKNTFTNNKSKQVNYSNPNSYIYKPYENEVLQYLADLYLSLQKNSNPFFFTEAYKNFQRKKHTLPMKPETRKMTEIILRKLMLSSNNTNNNTSPLPRRRKTSFNTFSNTNSNTNNSTNTNKSSYLSFSKLRNNTRRVPRKRLQGVVVKPSPKTLSLKEE